MNRFPKNITKKHTKISTEMENVSTNTLMEPDQSQLRQMVLENTERIDKQETMIDKILMESADFSQKMREKHDRLEHSNEEHGYSIKAIRKP
jgi:uncharacterized membrane protein YfhO